MFHELLIFFAQTYREQFGMIEGPPLHDPIAVAAALAPEIFEHSNPQEERFEIYVVTEGEPNSFDRQRRRDLDPGQCGRTVARMVEAGEPGIRIPRTLNIPTFWYLIDLAMNCADEQSPLRTERV